MPADPARLEQDCYEAYNIQVAGLQRRLEAIGGPKVVIGVSGGLDSTHALIVAAKAMDRAGRPRSDILGFTMPGFATSDETKGNAHELMRRLGITAAEIDITATAELMLREIDHPYSRGEQVYDVTFENVQAGLRTDYLFRIANQRGGIVLGTGDLSELALGWATYGVGDQMSHYNVNAGVPKTLIQHLIRWVVSSHQFEDTVDEVLTAILETEISPELVPGEELQSTESQIGPYALHDFTLFHVLRFGFRPTKIGFLAWHAWSDRERHEWPPNFPEAKRTAYDEAEIREWLERVLQALLRLRPVQALGAAERPQGLARRLALAARRLACPVRLDGSGLAARPRALAAALSAAHRRQPRPRLVQGRVLGHPGDERVLAAHPIEDVAPQGVGVLGEELARQRCLDDPRLLVDLVLELARGPAREARVDAAAANGLGQLVELRLGRDEPDLGDDDPGRLLGIRELAEDDERLRLDRAADEDRLGAGDRLELRDHRCDLGLGGPVEDDSHRPVVPVLGDQDDAALEVRIGERRRGDQELSAQ